MSAEQDQRDAELAERQRLERSMLTIYGADRSRITRTLHDDERDEFAAYAREMAAARVSAGAAPSTLPEIKVETTVHPIQTTFFAEQSIPPSAPPAAPSGGSTPDLPTDDGYYVLNIASGVATWVKLDTADATMCVDGTFSTRSVLLLPA